MPSLTLPSQNSVGTAATFAVGLLVGWTSAKGLVGFLWATKRATCLRWLNSNSKAFGFKIAVANETNRRDAAPPAPTFVTESIPLASIDPTTEALCCDLWARVFSKKGRTADTVREGLRAAPEQGEIWHVVWTGDGERRVVAAARTFRRHMTFGGGAEAAMVLGLAHVASDSAYRGLGLGAKVVVVALRRLDAEDAGVRGFLFQTGVEDFYRKLGARTLHPSRFPVVNSTGRGSDAKRKKGFWDSTVMTYPSAVQLPEGAIDILGPGF